MAKERKKPGPKPIPIDYDAVAFFCRSQISDSALARKLNISPQVLSNRLKRDPKLREAREGGAWDGKNIVSDAMFRKMLDRYMTICKDCQKIRFSFEKFYDKCPYCEQSRPIDPETGLDEHGNDHTNVKHKFVPGDTQIMIHWSKTHLGMGERVIHEGNPAQPLEINAMIETPAQRLARYKGYFDEIDKDKRKVSKGKEASEDNGQEADLS
ncbi:MAG: hypothetical protein WC343_07785 [Bacilli bacterium]|jgi:hypothetical protein